MILFIPRFSKSPTASRVVSRLFFQDNVFTHPRAGRRILCSETDDTYLFTVYV
ncbi:hypothetical protein LX24_01985 [Desulfallas thermosapovorans DSM 6562]|uniref:Uncharacterized protein n=1 Tax=Desulfallas thermosapovorans DSM 6562 TaxID=1121431 RepID=A0A5S4ZQI9_9FIRM|nr:hypothetical protein LX24_01985 [Desulfallas thermosapovorans DSM 6562]